MTELHVNGTNVEVAAPADAPLLWVLRDEVGDRSPEYGCGLGQCGACRVLVDGVPEFSCQLSVGDVVGREITTARGLATTAVGGTVQQALSDHNAGQCGYCLAGIAVTLTFLADRPEPPDQAMVLRALDEHICRCGSHPRILRAARSVIPT